MTWSVIAITFFLIMAVVTFLFKKKIIKDEKTNYKTLFIIGMTWLPLGVAIKNLGFIVGGLVLNGSIRWLITPKSICIVCMRCLRN